MTFARVAKNVAWLGVSKILVTLMSFAYSVYVTRYLGNSLTGKLATATSWTWVLMFVASLGLGTLLTRDVARTRSTETANKYLVNILAFKLILSSVAYFLLLVLMQPFSYSEDTLLVARVLGINIFLFSISTTFFCMFRAYERMAFDAIWDIVKNGLLLIGGFAIVKREYGLLELALVQVVVGVLEIGYYVIMTRRFFFRPNFKGMNLRFWPYLIRGALPFGIAAIFSMLYSQLDIILLSVLRTNSEVGWYNVANAFRINLHLVPAIILSALFPAIAAAYESPHSLKRIYEKAYKMLFAIGFSAAIGITLLARRFIPAIYTPAFAPSAAILQLLVWASVAFFVQQAFAHSMMATNLSQQYAGLVVGGTLLKLTLDLVLIPVSGALGAAIASVVVESAIAIVAYIFLVKQVGYFPIGLSTVRSIAASLVMASSILLLNHLAVPWFKTIPIAGLVYVGTFLMVGGLSCEEIRLLRNSVRRRYQEIPPGTEVQ